MNASARRWMIAGVVAVPIGLGAARQTGDQTQTLSPAPEFVPDVTFKGSDSYGDPVLYWYRTVRDARAPSGARFVPELIHNRSGVGSQLVATDINKDGAIDIVSTTNRGTFVFWGIRRAR